MRCSSKKNEALTFDVNKDSVLLRLYFYKGPNQGKARIIVDGALAKTIDLYRATPQYRFAWKYGIPDQRRKHTVKVLILREKRNVSTGYQVCFDGYGEESTFTDDTNYNIRYEAWGGAWNGKALGGGYRVSSTAGSLVRFTIRGRSFRWITARGPNYGQADIYVDDKFFATVDLYSSTQKWQHALEIKNLSQGSHTVKIVVLGQRNSASGGNAIVFDGISVP
ncbi:MAG: hypothetical protein C4583_02660 [Anaerolineaceae bacterium]|nr:MAG: hypothetical protein C4583_02660 [Anaerolineaceae bacterium]